MAKITNLPIIDMSSSDRESTANSIRQACVDCGFFYIINHGIDDGLKSRVFDQSKKFFALPDHEKMRLKLNNDNRGYTPMFFENLDPSVESKGDMKEGYYIGPSKDVKSECNLNQWPSKELLPFWKETMECYHEKILALGTKLLSIVALALNLDENFFEKISALKVPNAFIRLLHYPGNLSTIVDGRYGASAHSDYGMITLLVTDGVPGLQICREKDVLPRQWEDVHHIHGAFIVNIGDMLERWTNCLFRSTLHRVLSVGQERYSVAFFLDPSADCIVECLESCCSEACPPRFPPIRSGDYLFQRMTDAYSLK